jgi:hypothetical protein
LEMSQFISRQMMENKQNLNNDFNGQANIAKVERNATDGLNLQTIDASEDDLNRQKIEASALAQNKQLIDGDDAGANRQQLDLDAIGEHKEVIDPEARAQNIQEVVGQVHKKLDQFEKTNFSFLAIGRAQKFTDDFVPVPHESSGVNRQQLEASFARMGRSSLVVNLGRAADLTSSKSNTHHISFATDSMQDVPSAIHVNHGAPREVRAASSQDLIFAKPQSAGLRMYLGKASLTQRSFKVPYKQIAVALATVVFASPIYTQSTKSRVAVGPLVMLHQAAPELLEQRQAFGAGLTVVPQLR